MSTTLHPTELTYCAANSDREAARRARDRAIRIELATGKTLRAVAAEFGLSHQRIAQIRDGGS